MPFLIAVGAFFAALIGGIVLYVIGLEWLGIVIALASLPCALARVGHLGRPAPLTALRRQGVTGEPVDVAIIGGGMAGISGALEARRRGARVVLFDPGPIGGT